MVVINHDHALCNNANCPLNTDCARFSMSGGGYFQMFNPVRRIDGKLWCSMYKTKKQGGVHGGQ